MSTYLGIDCGTQSTKAVIFDAISGKIVARGQCSHNLHTQPDGTAEQQPSEWVEALITAVKAALAESPLSADSIAGIGASGQQHGLVALDKNDQVLCPAKLWCDTSTSSDNDALVKGLGGQQGCIETLGLPVLTGYTASKIAWLKRTQPDTFNKLASVLLPHDYLNFWLSGEKVMEAGDASGTGLMDIRSRKWSATAINQLDASGILEKALPALVSADKPIGSLSQQAANQLGLKAGIPVAPGGGDNMMGAIGTGNVRDGAVTISLGTSGTLYSCSSNPASTTSEAVANFCDSTGKWLPLMCTLNATSATENIRKLFGLSHAAFTESLASAPIGSEGVLFPPFFSGERVPDLPSATASILGLNQGNLTQANLCRSLVESICYGFRYGLDNFNQAGIQSDHAILIGGGSHNPEWRRILSNVLGLPIRCPLEEESAALGAALQAMWVTTPDSSIEAICDQYLALDPAKAVEPNPEAVAQYQALYQQYQAALIEHYSE